MFYEILILVFTGFAITILGALPFGLVNLSVLNESLNNRPKQAMLVANGASLVELVYGTVSLLTGKLLMINLYDNAFVKRAVIAILVLTALYFFNKKEKQSKEKHLNQNGFAKGVVLNLLSVQVFLYWVFAIAVAFSLQPHQFAAEYAWVLLAGIWPAKMFVLWLYMKLGERLKDRSGNKLSQNMNFFIGGVLLLVAVVQIIR